MIDPKRVALQVTMRSGQMMGNNNSLRELSYQAGYTAADGRNLPPSSVRDAVLTVEAELAEIIANDKMNPYRSLLYGRSTDLANKSRIPTHSGEATVGSDEGSDSEEIPLPFIGIFSQINDSLDHSPLTEQAVQTIRRYNRGSYLTQIYNYCFLAGRIIHTREFVYFEGCVFDRDAAVQRFNPLSTDLSPLPTSLESTWVARCIEYLVQEGHLQAEGAYYSEFARSGIARLKNRETELPVLPTTNATSKPESN